MTQKRTIPAPPRLLLPIAALALSACTKPPAIEKDSSASASDNRVRPVEAQGRAQALAPVETKDDVAPAIAAEAPKSAAKAPAPTAKEWETATDVAVHAKKCEVRRIDAFVRVKCATASNRIEQLVGDVHGVRFGCYQNALASCVVFRLDPGDRRIVQFASASFGGGWEGGGVTLSKDAVVSAWWPKGATEPKILLD